MKWKRGMTIWCILIVLTLGLLGISYAAYTDILIADFSFGTSNMSFVFDKDNRQEVTVQMQNGTGDSLIGDHLRDLGGNAVYEDKKLTITDIGPIDIRELQDGNAIITITYAIKTEDKEQSAVRAAAIEKKKDPGYDLGTVEFELMSHTPVWSINHADQAWGNASGNIRSVPDIIYDFLPDSLGSFQVYHTLLPHSEDGVMIGTLKLEQLDTPKLPDKMEIGLSSLGLPAEICDEIKIGSPDSKLEIEGTYGFTIPLDLDQFNAVN